ncbi:hypothetical protein K1719_046094 [Acacia pycnantha]|nr:hypothetical protein K1719_046094 [Acacia pycnantha]
MWWRQLFSKLKKALQIASAVQCRTSDAEEKSGCQNLSLSAKKSAGHDGPSVSAGNNGHMRMVLSLNNYQLSLQKSKLLPWGLEFLQE